MLTAVEWHNYAFFEGFAGFDSPPSKSRTAGLSVGHDAHHCPLCDFHISNTLLPKFNCVYGAQIILPEVNFLLPAWPPACQSFRLPESRGPPSFS
jgi:hypothetical protein